MRKFAGMMDRCLAVLTGHVTPILYAGSTVTTAVAQLLAGALIIRWVPPAELGLWHTVRLAQIYSVMLLAGVNYGLNRELPYLLGKGESESAKDVLGTTLLFTTIVNIFVLAVGIASIAAFSQHGTHLKFAIAAVAVVIVLSFYQQVFTAAFRSKDSFATLTSIQFVEAGMTLGTVPLIQYFGYNGMLVRTVLITSVTLLLLFWFRPIRVGLRWRAQSLKLLLQTGLPLFGLDYLKNSCATVDKVVVLSVGGVKAVGIYALASIVLQTFTAVSSSLGAYIYPRLTYRYGKDHDPSLLWGTSVRFAVLAAGLAVAGAGVAWATLPQIVPILAPEYLPGLDAARILALVGVSEGVCVIVHSIFSMKRWRLVTTYQISSALLYTLGPFAGVLLLGRSLEAIAWGVVFASLLRAIIAVSLTYIGTRPAPRADIRSNGG